MDDLKQVTLGLEEAVVVVNAASIGEDYIKEEDTMDSAKSIDEDTLLETTPLKLTVKKSHSNNNLKDMIKLQQ